MPNSLRDFFMLAVSLQNGAECGGRFATAAAPIAAAGALVHRSLPFVLALHPATALQVCRGCHTAIIGPVHQQDLSQMHGMKTNTCGSVDSAMDHPLSFPLACGGCQSVVYCSAYCFDEYHERFHRLSVPVRPAAAAQRSSAASTALSHPGGLFCECDALRVMAYAAAADGVAKARPLEDLHFLQLMLMVGLRLGRDRILGTSPSVATAALCSEEGGEVSGNTKKKESKSVTDGDAKRTHHSAAPMHNTATGTGVSGGSAVVVDNTIPADAIKVLAVLREAGLEVLDKAFLDSTPSTTNESSTTESTTATTTWGAVASERLVQYLAHAGGDRSVAAAAPSAPSYSASVAAAEWPDKPHQSQWRQIADTTACTSSPLPPTANADGRGRDVGLPEWCDFAALVTNKAAIGKDTLRSYRLLHRLYLRCRAAVLTATGQPLDAETSEALLINRRQKTASDKTQRTTEGGDDGDEWADEANSDDNNNEDDTLNPDSNSTTEKLQSTTPASAAAAATAPLTKTQLTKMKKEAAAAKKATKAAAVACHQTKDAKEYAALKSRTALAKADQKLTTRSNRKGGDTIDAADAGGTRPVTHIPDGYANSPSSSSSIMGGGGGAAQRMAPAAVSGKPVTLNPKTDLVVPPFIAEDLFVSICAALQCNGFGVYNAIDRCIAIGSYPFASYFNHSCNPNICRVMTGGEMRFYSLRPIAQGEPLCISYVDIEKETAERRHDLLKTYRFYCHCPRCEGLEKLTCVRCGACVAGGYLCPVSLPQQREGEVVVREEDVQFGRCTVCRKVSPLSEGLR